MVLLDDVTRLHEVDSQGMLDFLHRLPEVAEAAFARGRSVQLPASNPRQVLVMGMGGSAISGDLARNLLFDQLRVPLSVSRHCTLPAHAGPQDLAVLLSYSGNTAETLGCLEAAIARGIPTVLVTSGGAFAAHADRHGLSTVRVEAGWQPRAALGELYFSLLGVLSQLDGANIDPAAAVAQLRADRAEYLPEVPLEKNLAKRLAHSLRHTMPIVFGVFPTTEAVAQRWKCQINENSKRSVLFNVFPELTHNEIVNLAAKPHHDHTMILLRDPDEPALLARQVAIARELIRPSVAEVIELTGRGQDALSRQLSLVYLGDYVSVYLALASGIDPTPVEAIGRLKEQMAAAEAL